MESQSMLVSLRERERVEGEEETCYGTVQNASAGASF